MKYLHVRVCCDHAADLRLFFAGFLMVRLNLSVQTYLNFFSLMIIIIQNNLLSPSHLGLRKGTNGIVPLLLAVPKYM